MQRFQLPFTLTQGMGPARRDHLRSALSQGGVAALKRHADKKGGIVSSDQHVLAVMRSAGGMLEESSLSLAPRTIQDSCGGAAFALMGDWALFEDLRTAIQDRVWFDNWSIYHLPGCAVLCPRNPAAALEQLQQGYGHRQLEPKVVGGVFALLAPRDLSNHERLHLAPHVEQLVADLVAGDLDTLDPEARARLSGFSIQVHH